MDSLDNKQITPYPQKYKYDTFNPYIFDGIPKGKRVLDIGCGTGLLGKKLREEKGSIFLGGIEKDPGMAELAKQSYDRVITLDLDRDGELPFERGFFDVIVCADVIEHLSNPLRVLKNLSPYLSKEGFFLFSVPNVAFASVRLSLLMGRFDYNPDGGIMDETHLRFFTRESFIRLLKQAHLEPFIIQGYCLVRPIFFFLKMLSFILPTLFSIQFLVKARKIVESV